MRRTLWEKGTRPCRPTVMDRVFGILALRIWPQLVRSSDN